MSLRVTPSSPNSVLYHWQKDLVASLASVTASHVPYCDARNRAPKIHRL